MIDCNKAPNSLCHSCVLGKQVKLLFSFVLLSHTVINHLKSFIVIFGLLWLLIFLVMYKYYVLFLDHFTNFSWNFLLTKKSQNYFLTLSLNSALLFIHNLKHTLNSFNVRVWWRVSVMHSFWAQIFLLLRKIISMVESICNFI